MDSNLMIMELSAICDRQESSCPHSRAVGQRVVTSVRGWWSLPVPGPAVWEVLSRLAGLARGGEIMSRRTRRRCGGVAPHLSQNHSHYHQ